MRLRCLLKGHEMTETFVDKTIYDYRGLKFWGCKRCGFQFNSRDTKNFEGVVVRRKP